MGEGGGMVLPHTEKCHSPKAILACAAPKGTRVWVLSRFGLKAGMVFKGTTGAYTGFCQLHMNR